MGKESSNRIQTSLLSAVEKKALIWLAERQPRWMTSDMLTYIGVLGAMLCAVGYVLANQNLNWLWLASFGFVVNWYGDSLDGTLARVRQLQRPIYGFFIDHSLDALTICIFCIGAGLSPIFKLDIALLALAGYLVLSVYTYICTILKDEFRLTYGGAFGPTEFRLIVILLNTVYFFMPLQEISYEALGRTWSVYDMVGAVIALLLFIIWFGQFLKDRAYLAEKDPAKPYNPTK